MSEEIKTEEIESQIEQTEIQCDRDLSASSETDVDAGKNKETVGRKKTESFDIKLRNFKKQSSGIISEIRKREAYDKPSVKRKKKSKEARRHNKNNYRVRSAR